LSMMPALPPKFAVNFGEALKNHRKETLVPFILSAPERVRQCAGLVWPCFNGSSARYVALSKKWTARRDSQLQDAITGAEAEIDIFSNLINDPTRVNDAQNRLRDYVETRKMRKALPAKKLGTGQDWTIVQHTKESIEKWLCKSLPLSTFVALLNAGAEAAGKDPSYTFDSVRNGLRRLRNRLPIQLGPTGHKDSPK
ncbi:MAG: hypothetical protein WBX04_09205, partial [Candidatus Sulfotelmatobacter sp.]